MPACSTCGFESERPFRFCPECGTERAAAPSREQRKTVTVLFCDLTGSTALGETLDPERLRALLANYFELMKAIVERHGGTVEKFIGDAVMAVFGVPVVHEDDALRAVRSAVEMRDALPELGLQGRIGVMTGEVVTGTEERLATGDAVNVAARLEQAAQPGEVLIGQPTLALVRDAAEVEPIDPLELKGKAEPVPAFRLLRVREAPERRHGARFVGRDHELAILREAWERVEKERRCELVTVMGDAGVGKSRLASEFLGSIEATVAQGRCPPYGEGITYWPVVEVLKQLDVSSPEEAAVVAIRSLLGESDAAASSEEIAWAFRKTLEHAAAEGPLVVVFDDIQWGEQTFHDLIEHVALLSSDASILLLCMARPELSGGRPTWPVTLRLEPLPDDDVEELMAERVPGELRTKIARAAGGNPLFIEEMLAMAGEGNGQVVVPPTLQALLAARLDQLEPAERSVLERAAIEGEIFHRGAVQALAPAETQVTPNLAALVRKELIRPDRPQFAGEDGFRFRHLLIRDAAYDALPKATRAELHARLASWLEQHGSELVELDEIVGYHLEQACRYRAELGMPDDEQTAAARRRLTAAGFRANLRQDYGAAVSLFERAAALVPAAEFDLALETELGDRPALDRQGRRGAAARGCPRRACRCGRRSCRRALREDPGEHGRALPRAGGHDGEAGCAHRRGPARVPGRRRRPGSVRRLRRALRTGGNARADGRSAGGLRAGLRPRSARGPPTARVLRAASLLRFAGTTPVPELLAWLDENESREGRDYFFRAYRAGGLAMLGRFDEARAILAEARAELAERGGGSCSRTSPRSNPSGWSSGPAIPSPQPSSERRGSGCTRSWGIQVSCRMRPAPWRWRSTRSTSSTRQTPGPAAPRSSARATTPIRRCYGDGSGRRCSRAVASTPTGSGSPSRPWRSAMRPTCSTRREMCTPTSQRCSCSPAARRSGRRARDGARALRAQGQPRLGAARAGAARRAP